MSQWARFYKRPLHERRSMVADHARLSEEELEALERGGGLSLGVAEELVENVVGTFALPLGLAVGFVIDGQDVVVPMVVEESSVIAAACHGAKLAAAGGGFTTSVDEPITIGQVEIRGLDDVADAAKAVRAHEKEWMTLLDQVIPAMVQRGGGLRSIVPRTVGKRLLVHLHVDTRNAQGANVVNSLCERIAPTIAKATGGSPGLRILSNLADQRTATASVTIPAAALGGSDAVAGIVAANELAIADPYRAATHNKGIMNGIDPVAVATGNDWRAIEAGAHAFAARGGAYRALTEYRASGDGDLQCRLHMPLSVGTVGGATRIHPMAAINWKILGRPDARRLAGIMASVGLAQNLAALRALAGEGIQKGHMALHARNLAIEAGVPADRIDAVVAQMRAEGDVSAARARQLAGQGPTG